MLVSTTLLHLRTINSPIAGSRRCCIATDGHRTSVARRTAMRAAARSSARPGSPRFLSKPYGAFGTTHARFAPHRRPKSHSASPNRVSPSARSRGDVSEIRRALPPRPKRSAAAVRTIVAFFPSPPRVARPRWRQTSRAALREPRAACASPQERTSGTRQTHAGRRQPLVGYGVGRTRYSNSRRASLTKSSGMGPSELFHPFGFATGTDSPACPNKAKP